MFAVIFEVQPKPEQFDAYLGLAKVLKPEIEQIDGFIDNERFRSTRTEARILSLSTWRDEKALIRWRTLAIHHKAQEKGRFEIFDDYHLRVGEIVADNQVPAGQALAQQRLDETEVGEGKLATITEVTGASSPVGADGMVDCEVFESLYTEGKRLLLGWWSSAAAGAAWTPQMPPRVPFRHRRVRVIRDYGMRDRREAPQYYPDVAGRSG